MPVRLVSFGVPPSTPSWRWAVPMSRGKYDEYRDRVFGQFEGHLIRPWLEEMAKEGWRHSSSASGPAVSHMGFTVWIGRYADWQTETKPPVDDRTMPLPGVE